MSKLFNEFSPVSLAAWKEKIQTDLKGADYREKLMDFHGAAYHLDPENQAKLIVQAL